MYKTITLCIYILTVNYSYFTKMLKYCTIICAWASGLILRNKLYIDNIPKKKYSIDNIHCVVILHRTSMLIGRRKFPNSQIHVHKETQQLRNTCWNYDKMCLRRKEQQSNHGGYPVPQN